MNEYTASNGVKVEYEAVTDRVDFHGRNPSAPLWFGEGEFQALREFFQHERDEELGRWRYPLDPRYVVYRFAKSVRVVDEADGAGVEFNIDQITIDHFQGFGPFSAATQAYFEAHPERKPWEDAKEGDVWIIKYGAGEYPAIFQADRFRDHGGSWDARDITAARRIWPVSDD